ncbi:MAG: O-succinylhomoserine sulfhydrylase [Pseudomonadota bacterium]
MAFSLDTLSQRTQLIRTGCEPGPEREHNEAIFVTSSFVFDSAQHAAQMFNGEEQGNVYSRFTNPTVRNFERRLARMEGGAYGIAFASGMSAISTVFMSILKTGDHVVASSSLFGATLNIFTRVFSRFGIDVTFVDLADSEAWRTAVRPTTRMLYLETPSNPLCALADIASIATIARSADALLVVDNAFCTPVLQKPLVLGADIVVHSATKYLDGQGRCVGGAAVTNKKELHEALFSCLRSTGACMSPFNAWVFSNGLETLELRMHQHCKNAQKLAEALQAHPGIQRVHYPGLPSHPQYILADRSLNGFGGIVSFEMAGGRDAAWSVIDNTRFLSITANLGDTKSTITHPATTTHGRNTQQERDSAGISEGLIRVSVGLESWDDILQDIVWSL